jgi:hypothetical protein
VENRGTVEQIGSKAWPGWYKRQMNINAKTSAAISIRNAANRN